MSAKLDALNKLQKKLLELKETSDENLEGKKVTNEERLQDFIGLLSDELQSAYEDIENLKKQVR